MVKNSKKRKRKAERKLNAKLAHVEQVGQIPSSVAVKDTLPDTLSYLDGNNYQLIFERYNSKDCEIYAVDAKSSKLLIAKFNEITRVNSRTIAETSLKRGKVYNNGNYASLFKGLEDDIELVEVKYAGEGRIICYFIDEYPHSTDNISNYCCVVAILRKHRETK